MSDVKGNSSEHGQGASSCAAGGEITALLTEVRSGKAQGWEAIIRELYPELRRLAHRARNPHDRLLETTAVVHEAWLRIAAKPDTPIRDRAHLMALAAVVMRQVVCDHARERLAQKRGAGIEALELSAAERLADEDARRFVELDEALLTLAQAAPRLALVVECRFFLGLDDAATAEVVGTSVRTVRRDWAEARERLKASLGA